MRIGIIGAGVAGMSAAWDLTKAGHDVTLFEAGSEIGGLAAGFKDDDWDWHLEKFYHHWFETDKEIEKLLKEMGRWDKVIWPRPKTSYWIDNEIVRSEISPSALMLPVSPLSILRMGATGVFLKLLSRGQFLERFTAHKFLKATMGNEAYSKFFKPLLIGKFSDDYQNVNMAWMWARIYTRSLRLGIFEGGFQAFLDTMGNAIRGRGATIHLDSPVEKIIKTTGEQYNPLLKLVVKGQEHEFDMVLSTTSPKLLLKMSPDIAGTPYGNQVASLKSIGALCVIFALRQPLLPDDTYWLNLPADTKDNFPFLALVEHTNWLPKEHYGGNTLVYCGDYVPPDHEYFQMSEEDLTERFLQVLPTFNKDFQPYWVNKSWVFRAPYAQPVPGVNHSKNIPALKTPVDGLYWASMSQVYPYDRGTNFAVEIGRRVARMMIQEANL